MSTIIQQLGDTLWSPSTNRVATPADILTDKVVMLYFSAHWCGPCRRFTPILSEFYKNLSEEAEVVFCSMDFSAQDFESYTADMPWWCLPQGSTIPKVLASRYGAEGIPHLIVIDKDGTTILNHDAISSVIDDPEGFPWRPKSLRDSFPRHYISSSDEKPMSASNLKEKYVMLYFSAHWCPPCRDFTPQLSKAYKRLKERRDDFEILFVSADDSLEDFQEYFTEMSFCAIPYEDRQAKVDLSKCLGVKSIPTLVMLGPENSQGNRTVINSNCIGAFTGDYISDFPYKPKPYGDLNTTQDNINDFKCLIVYHEGGDDEEQDDVVDAVMFAAEQYEDGDLKFYWVVEKKGLSQNVRQAVGLGDVTEDARMILLDVSDHGSYYLSNVTNITSDAILDFVKSPGTRFEIQ